MATPHDDLFHFVFQDVRHAAAWLVSALPRPVGDRIDWASLKPAPDKLRGDNLRWSAADLVFAAECHGSRAAVWIVAEHKAQRDAGVHDQMLRYCGLLRDRSPRRAGLPPVPVVPILLHHGEEAFEHEAPAPDDVLARLQPRVRFLVDDLSRVGEGELRSRALTPFGALALLCLRFLRGMSGGAALRAFERWGDLLRAVDRDRAPPLGIAAIAAIGCYTLMVVEVAPDDLCATFERLLERREETIMSTAERLRREGMEAGLAKGRTEGLTQGLTQGRAEALLRQLTRRFGDISPDTVARIRGASMPELDRWTDRILDATTLAEVFAD